MKFLVLERREEGVIDWWKEHQHPAHQDVENVEMLTRPDVYAVMPSCNFVQSIAPSPIFCRPEVGTWQ